MTAAWIVTAVISCFAGNRVSGRIIFLLNHRSQAFKTIDFVILGGVALVALMSAFTVPALIFYNLATEVHR
ncbi:hypothetical protein [Nonomuraea sp. SYSU D8015]|uniref:hypothetical protein n=1 Tax=Nonomuraea sp. SYSU D8015 TaxID=2593644 RepID=UPI001CB6DBDA|nr:hypothetical protein [Nonomuraea sp. SYSU D8015]